MEKYIQHCGKIKQDITVRYIHKSDPIQIGSQKFTERKDAGALLIRVFQSEQYIEKTVGMFRGFKIVPMEKGTYMLNVKLIGVNEYDVAIGDSDVGAITRLENETDSFEKKILSYEKEGAEESTKLAKAQIEVDKPFEYAEDSERINSIGTIRRHAVWRDYEYLLIPTINIFGRTPIEITEEIKFLKNNGVKVISLSEGGNISRQSAFGVPQTTQSNKIKNHNQLDNEESLICLTAIKPSLLYGKSGEMKKTTLSNEEKVQMLVQPFIKKKIAAVLECWLKMPKKFSTIYWY